MIALYYLWGEGDSNLVDEMKGVFESINLIPEDIINLKFKDGTSAFFVNPTRDFINKLRYSQHHVGYYHGEHCYVIRDYQINTVDEDRFY